MPWKESSVMDERLRFVARLLEGEAMTDVCRDFGISRKTGYAEHDAREELWHRIARFEVIWIVDIFDSHDGADPENRNDRDEARRND